MGGKAAKERRRMERLEKQGDAGRASQEAKERKKSLLVSKQNGHETHRPWANKTNDSTGQRIRSSENKKPIRTTPSSSSSSNRTKMIPRGKKPTLTKVAMKKKADEPKKKSFKKPKHLKRKLEQTDDDAAKAVVLSELQKLEERKKLFSIHQPVKRQKTESSPTTGSNVKPNHTIASTTDPKSIKPKNSTHVANKNISTSFKTTMKSDSVVKAQAKTEKLSPKVSGATNETSKTNAAIATTTSTPIAVTTAPKSGSKSKKTLKSSGDEPNLVMEPSSITFDESVPEEEYIMPTMPKVEAAGTAVAGSTNSKIQEQHQSKDSDEDDDDDDSDDSDTLNLVSKRQRGRRRKGQQDTEKRVKECNNNDDNDNENKNNVSIKANEQKLEKNSKKSGDTRRCIGRKPVTDFEIGKRYPGKVVYIKPFGVFIDINCHSEAFCHVSRLQDDFVEIPDHILKIGDEVNPRVVEIDQRQKRITVSLQSDQRIADEKASAEAHLERAKKRGRGKPNSTPLGEHGTNESPQQVQFQDGAEDGTDIPANDLVDAEGNFLKDESDMTPMELKRARKLARRAQRRTQKLETGISA